MRSLCVRFFDRCDAAHCAAFVLIVGLSVGLTARAWAQPTSGGTGFMLAGVHHDDVLKAGKDAYGRYCAGCHGEKGDGQGPAAPWLYPKPRDFTRGLYKFRTTPWGTLPTDEDIHRTIVEGVHGTSMPQWRLVSEYDRRALVQYVKSFSDRFQDPDEYEMPVSVPHPPDFLTEADAIKMGRTSFQVIGCIRCHGATGAGDGSSKEEMKDDWGQPIVPTNFHRGVLRGGRAPRDIYRAIATGYSGTPMPAFYESLTEERIWQLVAYIRFVIKNAGDATPQDVFPECQVWDQCDAETNAEGETQP